MTGATTSRAKSRTDARSASCSSVSSKSILDAPSDRRDAVPASRKGPVLAPRRREPGHQLGPQLFRSDDGVHDQLAGEPEDVDVLLVLGVLRLDEGFPLRRR